MQKLYETMKEHIGEIFSSFQGEGLYAGYRQVFVRFAGCNLRCVYCDTTKFWRKNPYCLVEQRPGSQTFKRVRNPVETAKIVEEIDRLRTPDVHSVSLTGGEPLEAGDFLMEVAREIRRRGLPVYLETNGSNSRTMRAVVRYLDYAAVDLKLPEHRAVPKKEWGNLLGEELECVRIGVEAGVKTFVKIVVLDQTKAKTVERVCERLRSIAKVPVVLQPVTPVHRKIRPPKRAFLFSMAEKIGKMGLEVRAIPQLHQITGIR